MDFYARFTSWRVDRLVHRQLAATGATQATQENRPHFLAYFDPSVDVAAALVHCLLGAGTAALLGGTGQINGAYAAVVVGMSAPMLLTQLSRIQTVNEAVTGNWQPVGSEGVAAETGTPPLAGTADTTSSTSEAMTAGTPPVIATNEPPPRTQPTSEPAAPTADPVQPTSRTLPAPRPSAAAGADAYSPEPAPQPPAVNQPQLRGDASRPAPPAADGTTSGLGDPGGSRWRQGPAIGEEGL
ncbi:hypothetical protein ACIRO1_45455 [Streptomyces sp. NPDC102381]|uniref:hypothetical protein n=1 Tax=Streptomyces sp. NPDC102381 TaxID=3366164 RepID=UPI003821AF32